MGISFKGLTQAIGGFVTSAPEWMIAAARRRSGTRVLVRPSKYTGEQLREIRKRKGVGRPPIVGTWLNQAPYPALTMSMHDLPSPNLAEWQRKQRRGESNEDYRARRAGIREVIGYTDDELIHVGRPA